MKDTCKWKTISKRTPEVLRNYIDSIRNKNEEEIVNTSKILRQEIIENVNSAILKLYRHDRTLIENKMYEVTICGRLAMYLQDKFKKYKDYYIDIEYYRLKRPREKANLRDDRIRCDILLHSRGIFESRVDNLLAIEVKLDESPDDGQSDRARLAEFVIPETPETPETAVHSTLVGIFIRLGNNGYSIGIFSSQDYIEVKMSKRP